jgi:hypothetical protein
MSAADLYVLSVKKPGSPAPIILGVGPHEACDAERDRHKAAHLRQAVEVAAMLGGIHDDTGGGAGEAEILDDFTREVKSWRYYIAQVQQL